MSNEPIEAAELVQSKRELSRYAVDERRLTRIQGRLEDVRTLRDGGVLILVRRVKGLERDALAAAELKPPRSEIDHELKSVGPGGPIALIGMARHATAGVTEIEMDRVQSINGTPVQ